MLIPKLQDNGVVSVDTAKFTKRFWEAYCSGKKLPRFSRDRKKLISILWNSLREEINGKLPFLGYKKEEELESMLKAIPVEARERAFYEKDFLVRCIRQLYFTKRYIWGATPAMSANCGFNMTLLNLSLGIILSDAGIDVWACALRNRLALVIELSDGKYWYGDANLGICGELGNARKEKNKEFVFEIDDSLKKELRLKMNKMIAVDFIECALFAMLSEIQLWLCPMISSQKSKEQAHVEVEDIVHTFTYRDLYPSQEMCDQKMKALREIFPYVAPVMCDPTLGLDVLHLARVQLICKMISDLAPLQKTDEKQRALHSAFIETSDQNSEETMRLIIDGKSERLKNIRQDIYSFGLNLNKRLFVLGFRYWLKLPDWISSALITLDLQKAVDMNSSI